MRHDKDVRYAHFPEPKLGYTGPAIELWSGQYHQVMVIGWRNDYDAEVQRIDGQLIRWEEMQMDATHATPYIRDGKHTHVYGSHYLRIVDLTQVDEGGVV